MRRNSGTGATIGVVVFPIPRLPRWPDEECGTPRATRIANNHGADVADSFVDISKINQSVGAAGLGCWGHDRARGAIRQIRWRQRTPASHCYFCT